MLNYIALSGNLEHAPEIRYPEGIDDQLAAGFSLAFETGNNRTGRIKMTCFGSLAALVGRYLHQACRVAVAGVLDQQQGENADGQKKSSFRLIARSLELLGTDGCSDMRQTQLETRLPEHQRCADIPLENLTEGSD